MEKFRQNASCHTTPIEALVSDLGEALGYTELAVDREDRPPTPPPKDTVDSLVPRSILPTSSTLPATSLSHPLDVIPHPPPIRSISTNQTCNLTQPIRASARSVHGSISANSDFGLEEARRYYGLAVDDSPSIGAARRDQLHTVDDSSAIPSSTLQGRYPVDSYYLPDADVEDTEHTEDGAIASVDPSFDAGASLEAITARIRAVTATARTAAFVSAMDRISRMIRLVSSEGGFTFESRYETAVLCKYIIGNLYNLHAGSKGSFDAESTEKLVRTLRTVDYYLDIIQQDAEEDEGLPEARSRLSRMQAELNMGEDPQLNALRNTPSSEVALGVEKFGEQ